MNTISNPLYFIGVVEDNRDPTNAGRVRVRCFGIHPPVTGEETVASPNYVPTEDLPWAVIINGTMGSLFNIPELGEWVFGMFIDGRDAQHPMILGTIQGQNLSAPAGTGLPGEDGYLRPSSSVVNSYGNLAIPPYMTGEHVDQTAAIVQIAGKNEDVATSNEKRWTEPDVVPPSHDPENTTVWQGKYAGNSVVINDGGDGVGGYMLITHNTGTVIQIDDDGNVLIKTFGDRYDVTEGYEYRKTKGDTNTNIGQDYNLKVENGSNNVWIANDMNIECNNFNVTARGKMTFNAAQSFEVKASKVSVEAHTENIDMVATKKMKIATGDSYTLKSLNQIYFESINETISMRSLKSIYAESLEEDVHVVAKVNARITATDGTFDVTSGDNMLINSGARFDLKSADTTAITAGAEYNLKSGSNMLLTSGSRFDVNASGNAYIEAPQVRMTEGANSASDANVATVATVSLESPENAAVPSMPEPPGLRPPKTGFGGVRANSYGTITGAGYDDQE